MNNIDKTLFIGTKFFGHDSALFIVEPDEKNIFGMSTERMTRYKHDPLSPQDVLERYIEYRKLDTSKVKRIFVGYSFTTDDYTLPEDFYFFNKHFRSHFNVSFKKDVDLKLVEFKGYFLIKKIYKLLSSIHGIKLALGLFYNKIFGQKRKTIRLHIHDMLAKKFPKAKISIECYDHETCHAISSHYTSPFQEELLFTFDGYGDGNFSKIFIANKENVREIATSKYEEINIGTTDEPEMLIGSVGVIYSYFTGLLGFIQTADEGKVEALAAYGTPIHNLLNDMVSLFSINKNNGLEIDPKKAAIILKNDRIKKIVSENKKEDIAASVQKFLEIVTKKYLLHIKNIAPFKAMSLSGGIAANVINNLGIFEEITENIHVIPAMADDGSAQGAAIIALLDNGYTYNSLYWMRDLIMPYYGTSYTTDEIKSSFDSHKKEISYEFLGEIWPEKVGELIAQEKIGAIFHGKMEWGPRALGNRSILASPLKIDFRDRINKEIKRRPAFQPFCPSILEEERERLFDKSYENKHMTCAFHMKKEFAEQLQSAVHIDGTARAQFVEEKDNPQYYRILKKVKELTGFGVIINTSFNKHG
ncbi:MAG: hypothetical protein A2W58_02780, partial [Candidatus Zambryskibacteria bacterium RIFCSPHIGHO2_02_38_10.5]